MENDDILNNTPTVGFVFIIPEGTPLPYSKMALYAAHTQDVLSNQHNVCGGMNVGLLNGWRLHGGAKDLYILRSASPRQEYEALSWRAFKDTMVVKASSNDLPDIYCVAFGPHKKSVIDGIAAGCESWF